MRILNANQIRELDAYTIEHEPITSIDLMERASRAFVDWFQQRVDGTKKIGIVCGTGNNGGDGLAIARMLYDWGYQVVVWIVKGGAFESPDFRVNEGRLPDRVQKHEVVDDHQEVLFDGCDVLIDAIFGSGLSRPPAGLYARVIEAVNDADALRIAVDVPSGLMGDAPSAPPIVRADHTLTFQLPKLAFLLPESFAYTGQWRVVDIGLNKSFIRSSATHHHYTTEKSICKILRPRAKFDHKGTYGHALMVAGSYGKMGAAILASRAALRAGVGLLTTHVPECGYSILQTAVPEAMVEVDVDKNIFTSFGDLARYNAVGVGPGLGQDKLTVKALGRVLERFGKPVVVDADALNVLSTERAMMGLVPSGSILTPHPKEFERLVGKWSNDFERLQMQKQLAISLKAVVVLKGAHTSVADEKGGVYFNSTGNPGMATGGSGDVLTGILTGLLAQKYTSIEAAVTGVYLHGLAGDLAASECGMEGLIATDLIAHLPGAFQKVARK